MNEMYKNQEYRTRAIISRGLYIFYLILKDQRVMMARVRHIDM